MKIRKYYWIAAVVIALAAFVSCRKEGLPFFRGTYGFVTSGSVSCVCLDDGASAEPFDCQILPERGIMHVQGDKAGTILTMSSIIGEAMVFPVTIEGADIALAPQDRMVSISVDSRSVAIPVTVGGSGHKTGDIIVLNLDYQSGVFTTEGPQGSHSYKLVGSNVRCVATFQE